MSFTDVLTSPAAAAAGQAVQVKFGWQVDGEYYVNSWQYGQVLADQCLFSQTKLPDGDIRRLTAPGRVMPYA
ncbi:hypothetical protein [Paraburkholderia silvatlantica]|uniref:Uncharacterized protein n=1 Tax=Paraburkholderia silvatlantica TaxID=321895 RepID=A0ABR6FV41_9BURK|nr:hypothetical protein [Paraburkholderia silvatlantica]MBB2930645.1 hypothetical protein [Paraburkholderia silvatlantica]